jgi:predicted nucleic acid-binding Zn ribbon protein
MTSLKELYPNYKEESELQPVYSNICTICGNDDTVAYARDLGKTKKCNKCNRIFEANVTKFIKPVEIEIPRFNFNNKN